MFDNEKRLFSELIDAVFPIYRMEASKETKRIWWEVLKRHEMADVTTAFSEHVSTNSKGITPADINNRILAANPDGRPGADEAWAMLPYRDESASVVMTEEMAEAFGIANEVDDKNGARMAFRDAYNRIVDRNKRAGVKPKWFASLGDDKNGREIVLAEAVRLGRITNDHATKMFPTPVTENGKAILSLVDNSKTDSQDEINERIAKLKALVS